MGILFRVNFHVDGWFGNNLIGSSICGRINGMAVKGEKDNAAW
jgi:hypothetical protein